MTLRAAGLLFLILPACSSQPSEELMIRHRWITHLDRDVLQHACPMDQRELLTTSDPLNAATQYAYRGKGLDSWVEDNSVDVAAPMPKRFTAQFDSLRATIAVIANSYAPAVATAERHHSECNGRFALNCDKRIRAQDVLSRIDAGQRQKALDDYFRHRAALDKMFIKAGAPLDPFTSCPAVG